MIYDRLESHHLNIHFACSYSCLEAFGFTVIYRFTVIHIVDAIIIDD